MSWMSSTKLRRFVYPAIVLVAAAVVGALTAWWGGYSSLPFLVMATLVLGWVLWLLYRAASALVKDPGAVDVGAATGKRRKELEREKQALLKALKELDFDHEMGKVSDKDFNDISTQYRARAIRVMRQLDDAGRDYEQMITRDLEKRKAPVDGAPPPVSDKCAKCGTRNDSDAEFCKKCGSKLKAEIAS
jgi:zinc ribbon protein